MAENHNAVGDNIGAGVGAIGFMENVPGDGFGDEESEEDDDEESDGSDEDADQDEEEEKKDEFAQYNEGFNINNIKPARNLDDNFTHLHKAMHKLEKFISLVLKVINLGKIYLLLNLTLYKPNL